MDYTAIIIIEPTLKLLIRVFRVINSSDEYLSSVFSRLLISFFVIICIFCSHHDRKYEKKTKYSEDKEWKKKWKFHFPFLLLFDIYKSLDIFRDSAKNGRKKKEKLRKTIYFIKNLRRMYFCSGPLSHVMKFLSIKVSLFFFHSRVHHCRVFHFFTHAKNTPSRGSNEVDDLKITNRIVFQLNSSQGCFFF